MWVDTPQFSTASQAQPYESGGCVIFMLYFYLFIYNLQRVFTKFSKFSGSRGKKLLSERREPIPIYVTCHRGLLDMGGLVYRL